MLNPNDPNLKRAAAAHAAEIARLMHAVSSKRTRTLLILAHHRASHLATSPGNPDWLRAKTDPRPLLPAQRVSAVILDLTGKPTPTGPRKPYSDHPDHKNSAPSTGANQTHANYKPKEKSHP